MPLVHPSTGASPPLWLKSLPLRQSAPLTFAFLVTREHKMEVVRLFQVHFYHDAPFPQQMNQIHLCTATQVCGRVPIQRPGWLSSSLPPPTLCPSSHLWLGSLSVSLPPSQPAVPLRQGWSQWPIVLTLAASEAFYSSLLWTCVNGASLNPGRFHGQKTSPSAAQHHLLLHFPLHSDPHRAWGRRVSHSHRVYFHIYLI